MQVRPAAWAILSAAIARGAAPAQFDPALFRGKEIAVLIGGGAGGGADAYARLLARHIGRHLPGHPGVVAKNVPGAGGIRVANQIFNISPRDGTEIATIQTSVVL